MRVVIDALSAVTGGGVTYFSNLLPALGGIDPRNEYVVLRDSWQRELDFSLPGNFRRQEIHLPFKSVFLRLVWEQVGLPTLMHQLRADLLLSPADITSIPVRQPKVLVIRNLNPYSGLGLEMGWRYAARNTLLRMVTRLSAHSADHIVFVSHYSQRVVTSILGIPIDKTSVVYHGLSQQFSPARKGRSILVPTDQPYVLFVSNIMEHKNLITLVRAFVDLCQDDTFAHHLVIAGRVLASREVELARRLITEAQVGHRVHFLGQIPYAELPALYSNADIFVLPSLLETFGHPLVEAMASGLPIVASNVCAMPEICGDAALYFDPHDTIALSTQIRRVLSDATIRASLQANGLRRASEFSWDKTAKEMLLIFEQVVSEHSKER